MDGVCRCVGGTIPVILDNVIYTLSPITIGLLARWEFQLLAARQSPVDSVQPSIAGMDGSRLFEEIRLRVLDDVWADRRHRIVPADEMEQWLDTTIGLAETITACLRLKGDPVCRDLAEALTFLSSLKAKDIAELVRRRDIVGGTDLLGSLEWPVETTSRRRKHAASQQQQRMPWRKILRHLASEYGWTPDQAADLTLWQVRLFTCDEKDLGGVTRMDPDAAMALQRRRVSPFRQAAASTATGESPARADVRRRLAAGEFKKRTEAGHGRPNEIGQQGGHGRRRSRHVPDRHVGRPDGQAANAGSVPAP